MSAREIERRWKKLSNDDKRKLVENLYWNFVKRLADDSQERAKIHDTFDGLYRKIPA